jgi:hypothetical protein
MIAAARNTYEDLLAHQRAQGASALLLTAALGLVLVLAG